jgi:hypothetical protein
MWRPSKQWDYLGVEFFEGRNLDTLSLKGVIASKDAIRYGERVGAALNRTLRSSTNSLANREIEQLFAKVCASPMFSGVDQKFLQNIVFPFVHAGALQGLPKSRWTNGDFLPRNILVDGNDNVRLIDYEFAQRTHFFGEDWWRWRTYSSFQSESRDIPALREGTDNGPWLEAYFILRQMVLVHDVSGAQLAVAETAPLIDRLVALTAEAHAGFRSSVLLKKIATGTGGPSGEIKDRPKGNAQLYWSTSANFSEQDSQAASYGAGRDELVRFRFAAMPGRLHLRLDPADSVGIIEIRAIRVFVGDKTLIALHEPEDWEQLNLGSGLVRLTNTPALNLLSFNGDPSVLLPEIEFDVAASAVTCEIWLKFAAELDALPDLMRSQVAALAELGSANLNQVRLLPEPSKVLLLTKDQLQETKAQEAKLYTEASNLRVELDELSAKFASAQVQTGELQKEAIREIYEIREKLGQAEARLREANDKLAEANERGTAERNKLDGEIAEKEARILAFEVKQVAILETLNSVETRLVDSERLRHEEVQKSQQQSRSMTRFRLDLEIREAQIKSLEMELLYLKQTEAQLRLSGSWRITAPLRYLRSILEKLFQHTDSDKKQ